MKEGFKGIINIILVILLLLTVSEKAISQTGEKVYDDLDAILDSILLDDELLLLLDMNSNLHFLYWRVNYNDRTLYAGREIGDRQYNASGQMYYFNSLGINIGISGIWYNGLSPHYSSTILSAGYSNSFKNFKSLRYRASYTRYFYHNTDTDFEPSFHGYFSGGFSIENSWIGSRLDLTILPAEEVGKQLSFDLYSNIRLFRLGKHDRVQFEPEISFYFGSETVEFERFNDRYPQIPVEYVYEDAFGMMNMQLILPLNISFKGINLEICYEYNLPRSLDRDYTYPNTSMISVSLGYILTLN